MGRRRSEQERASAALEEGRLAAALRDVHAGRYKNIAQAAARTGLCVKKLRRREKGAKSWLDNGGHNKLLSETEELAVLAWANWRHSVGSAITAVSLKQAVTSIFRRRPRYPDHEATVKWSQSWLTSHKHLLKKQRGRPRAFERRAAQDRFVFRQWFDAYKRAVDDYCIEPEYIWNSDETGFRVGVFEGSFVWCYTEIETLFQSDPDHRALVTVTEACSAAGRTIPPFLIMAGTNINAKHIMNSLEPGTRLTTSENGWTDDLIALEWLDHFLEHTKPLPGQEHSWRLLIVDNHGSHLTFDFHRRCLEANVLILPLPPHTTHKLQPLDVGVFRSFKAAHQRDLGRQISEGAVDYDRPEFLNGLKDMRRRAFKTSTIKSAWAKSGLHPFNPDLVLDNLEDPLTSAKSDAVITKKVGYIPNASDQITRIEQRHGVLATFLDEEPLQPIATSAKTPSPELAGRCWQEANTPSLDLRDIIPFEDWLEERLHASLRGGRPVSPTMLHVFSKMKKASHAAILAGARAIEELRRLKEADVQRKQRNALNRLVTRIGPIEVDDARLRAVNDANNRLRLQRIERRRLKGRDLRDEERILRRWLRDYKRLEGTRLKQLRARMRADKVKLKEITAAVRPQEEALRNEATLLARYWQQRRARHERYHELRNEAFVSACLRSKRAPEDVQLPPDWQPDEILEPYTPWQMPARGEGTVRKVMRFYWEQKYGPSRPFDVALPGFYTEEDYQISSAEATEATEASGGDDDVNSVSSSSQSDDKEAPDDCTDPAIQQG